MKYVTEFKGQSTKLGRNIRLVTRNKVVGSLGPDGRLKFLSAATATPETLGIAFSVPARRPPAAAAP